MTGQEPSPPSAVNPHEDIRYCCRCGAQMTHQLIGGKPRPVCPSCHFIHFVDPKVGVGVLVVQEGKVLLVRRAMNPEKGKWSLPAGYVDHGDDPQETAVRETLEETNLHVEIEKLIDVYYNPPVQGGASIFILYQAHLVGGDIQPGDDADAAHFFDLDDLPPLAFTSTQEAIAGLIAAQKRDS